MLSSLALVPFPLLSDPASYNPNTFCYSGGHPPRAAWLDAFRRTTLEFQGRASSDPSVSDAPAAAARFAERYTAALQELETPASPEGALRRAQCKTCFVRF